MATHTKPHLISFDHPALAESTGQVVRTAAAAIILGLLSAVLIGWGTGLWQIAVLYSGVLMAASAVALTIALMRRHERSTGLPNREILQEALNSSMVALAVTNNAGKLVCANRAYGELFGGYPVPDAEIVSDAYEITHKALPQHGEYQLWQVEPHKNIKLLAEATSAVSGSTGHWFAAFDIPLLLVSVAGEILAGNAALGTLIGRTTSNLQGRALADVFDMVDNNVTAIQDDGEGLPVRFQEIPLLAAGSETIGHLFRVEAASPTQVSISGQTGVVMTTATVPDFIERVPLALALADRDGRLIYANLSFRTITSAKLGDTVLYPSDLMTPEDRAPVSDLVRRVGAGAAAGQKMMVRLKANPDEAVQLSVTQAGAGAPASVVLTLSDNAEQKRLEQQVAQGQRMQSVGQLAGGIAHDFNNILTAIIGFCDLLLQRHPPGDASFADIQQVLSNANRAASLVKQLLAFSRQQTLRPSIVQVTDVISEQVTTLKRLIGERVTLEVIHGRNLGYVRVDPGQFDQVMFNLVVNARDALTEGGTIIVRTRAVAPNDLPAQGENLMPKGAYVEIEVADTGSGIPADVLPKIFEPFFTTKDVGKGTGLGLSTVYGIIKQSSGFIFVDSITGKGTTFSVYLPVHDAPVIIPEAAKASGVDDLWGHGTILLVEDEDAVRIFASKALERKGYKVLAAASGEEALNIVTATEAVIDLVVSDVVMPNMDGPTLVKHIRDKLPAVKIIFISGYAEETLRKSIDTPDVAFLPKPFSLKDLAQAVKRVMDEKKP